MNMSYVHTVKSSLLTLTHSGCTITAQFLRNLISRTSRKQLKPISARAAAAPPPSSVIHRVTDGGESSCAAVLLLGRPKLSDRRHCVNMVRMIVGIPRFQAHFIPEVFGLVANRIRRGEKEGTDSSPRRVSVSFSARLIASPPPSRFMQYLRPSVQCEFEGSVHGQALGRGKTCMMDVEANPDNFGGVVWISF